MWKLKPHYKKPLTKIIPAPVLSTPISSNFFLKRDFAHSPHICYPKISHISFCYFTFVQQQYGKPVDLLHAHWSRDAAAQSPWRRRQMGGPPPHASGAATPPPNRPLSERRQTSTVFRRRNLSFRFKSR